VHILVSPAANFTVSRGARLPGPHPTRLSSGHLVWGVLCQGLFLLDLSSEAYGGLPFPGWRWGESVDWPTAIDDHPSGGEGLGTGRVWGQSGLGRSAIRGGTRLGWWGSTRHNLVFGWSSWTLTMMQSCASAAKLLSGGPILLLGIKAMVCYGRRHLGLRTTRR
jgi:hypothetical protein